MKMIKILQTVSLFSILIIAASCRSSKPTTGRQYPRNSPPPKEYPTKTPNEYPGKSYPVVYEETSSLPPGQAKKVYGDKSAKAYAPGQRKKYAARYPLIIVRTPDIIISHDKDGHSYYKNKEGIMYWKGSDDRFYVDEKYLKEMEYNQSDYDDWKVKGQKIKEEKVKKDKDEKEEKDKNDQKPKNENSQKGKGNSKNKS